MKALKLFTLIFFLSGSYQLVKAGPPVGQVQSKGAATQEQKHQVIRPASSMDFNNPNNRARSQVLLGNMSPSQPHQLHGNAGRNFFRSDFGHIMNMGHMVYIGISEINMRCSTYTDADKFRDHLPSPGMRNREIALVSAISAVCITGLILAPIIHNISGNIRYRKGVRGTYTISPDAANGMGVVARF